MRQSWNKCVAHALSFATKGANHQNVNLQLFSQLNQCLTSCLTLGFLFLVPNPIQLQQALIVPPQYCTNFVSRVLYSDLLLVTLQLILVF